MPDILSPGPPEIYLFRTKSGVKDYHRKWDGTQWHFGRHPGSLPKEVAKAEVALVTRFRIDKWIAAGMTVEHVADLSGDPLQTLTQPQQIQLDLFQ